MLPTYYRGCWHVVSRSFLQRYRQNSPLWTEVYNPRAFIPHAVLLHQGFPHCAIFPTAASRRSLGRVSVPMWPFSLSTRLPIVVLVSIYLANKLIGRELILKRKTIIQTSCEVNILRGISTCFQMLFPTSRQITHALLTRPPLVEGEQALQHPFDLHVLGIPPAFVLSQDQTLKKEKRK